MGYAAIGGYRYALTVLATRWQSKSELRVCSCSNTKSDKIEVCNVGERRPKRLSTFAAAVVAVAVATTVLGHNQFALRAPKAIPIGGGDSETHVRRVAARIA